MVVSVVFAGLPVRAQEPPGWNDVVKKVMLQKRQQA
jgi:hypothetical protein